MPPIRMLYITVILFLAGAAFAQGTTPGPLHLTPEQQSWIRLHPIVYYSVPERWPQEYVKNGKHNGLSRTVLDVIEQSSGLKFVYISPENSLRHRPMMIPAVNAGLLTVNEQAQWLWTFPWANIMPMIVGKNDSIRIRTLDQLVGKRVAIAKDSDYVAWLQRHYPGIDLIEFRDVLDALHSVDNGDSQAAIASGLVMLPILQRHYFDRLAISAQIPEMVSGIRMAVDPAYPELRDILNESMENISAADAHKIFTRWIRLMDMGTPTWGVILYHYRYHLLAAFIFITLLLFTLRKAMVARKQAQKSEKEKTDFLNIMSHEIRTPMNAIVASLELLLQTRDAARKQQYAELAASSSCDLLELLNNVLDLSKLSRDQLSSEPEACQLDVLVRSLWESHLPAAYSKALNFRLEFSPALSQRWFNVDKHRLRQILNNLLSNAIKFTQQGSVELRVYPHETLPSSICFNVRDTGPGISPETQGRLFEAWEQGSDSGLLNVGGSGLGLYISRELTRLMGGSIVLQSQPGKGTKIELELPAAECPAPESAGFAENVLPDYCGELSMLLVEDHAVSRQLIGEQLNLMGCFTEYAIDGESALELLESENYYDVILLDCGLPGIDGYETAARVRRLEQHTQREPAFIVAISALNSSEHRQMCIASGMNDILSKPVRLSQLATILQSHFPACKTSPPQESLPSVPVSGSDVTSSLREDVAGFHLMASENNLSGMIYYVHRIHGVALMFGMSELADFTCRIEHQLRVAPDLSELPVIVLSAELDDHIALLERRI